MVTITLLDLSKVTHIAPAQLQAQANLMLIHRVPGAEFELFTKVNLTEARWITAAACK